MGQRNVICVRAGSEQGPPMGTCCKSVESYSLAPVLKQACVHRARELSQQVPSNGLQLKPRGIARQRRCPYCSALVQVHFNLIA